MGSAGCERGWFTVMVNGWMVFGVVAGGRECRSVGVPGCRSAGVPECRSAGVPGCRGVSVGVSGCRSAGVPECRSFGVQEYWRGGYASGKGEG